jgi:hypothetical protein
MTVRKQLAVLFLASVLGSVSCAAQQSKPDAASFEEAVTAAEAARKQAASVGGEWRDTGKLITKAKAAAEKGDFAKAIELATTARKQGELGYQQSMDQKNAAIPAYMTQ